MEARNIKGRQRINTYWHTKGKSERRLSLGGKTVNLFCQILSFRHFVNDQERCLGPNREEGGTGTYCKAAEAVELDTFVRN